MYTHTAHTAKLLAAARTRPAGCHHQCKCRQEQTVHGMCTHKDEVEIHTTIITASMLDVMLLATILISHQQHAC